MAKLTILEMAVLRMQAMAEIERQKEEIAKLDKQLIPAMKRAKLTETPAVGVHAFRLQQESTCDYNPAAYELAKKNRVIGLFTPEAKITASKLAAALKKKKIDLDLFTALAAEATNEETKDKLVKFEVKADV